MCSREIPVIDAVASDYQDDVVFLAIAGRSSFEASARRAGDWFSTDRLRWGYADDLWALYEIVGPPASILISGDDVVVAGWYGAAGEAALREQLDALVAIG